MLPFSQWPKVDRGCWQSAFRSDGFFGESGPGVHLAEATRHLRRESYGMFLGFVATMHPKLLVRPPEKRVNPQIVAEYVTWRRRSCGEMSLAADLRSLRSALKLICPDTDWSWLQSIANRLAAAAPPRARKFNLVTSERLYALGIELMDSAMNAADITGQVRTRHAIRYRDGLIIGTLAMIPLRLRTLAALKIGRQLKKVGKYWELDIP
jgi:hypothetical protein